MRSWGLLKIEKLISGGDVYLASESIHCRLALFAIYRFLLQQVLLLGSVCYVNLKTISLELQSTTPRMAQ